MKKSILTLALALMMCLSLLPMTAMAATEVDEISKVGDIAKFGSYFGKPIEWQALAVDATAGKALLIPTEMVGYRSFNDNGEGTTWENSSIRKWLNNEFYNTAFSAQQKAFILESDLENKANSQYSTGGGANTKDKVFLLSIDEATKYFSGDDSRMAEVNFTEQQISNIAQELASRNNAKYTVTVADAISELTSYNGTTDWWWLRTSGRELTRTAAVSYSGELYVIGNEAEEPFGGLRPAIWVDISNPSWNASAWATAELERADALGLIPDSLKEADLTKPITRAEFAAVAVKAYEALSGVKAIPAVNNPFTDTTDVEVLKAYNVGITSGTAADKFSPNVLLNREQCATMLTRVFKKVSLAGWTLATDSQFTLPYTKPAPFADDAKISDWAKDSVYFMAANGVIAGTGNNMFSPRATTSDEEARGYAQATREQAIVIAVRMIEKLG